MAACGVGGERGGCPLHVLWLEQAADQTPRCCAARCTWRRLVVTVVAVACLPLTALDVTADVLVEVAVVSAVVVVGGVVDR